jgi:hydrogenase-4 component B
MIAGMLVLAGACVLLGVLPGAAIALLDRPTAMLLHGTGAAAAVTVHGPLVLSSSAMGTGGASLFMTGVAVLFVALALAAWILRAWPRAAGLRREPTWTCGMAPSARFDYSATAFAKPLRLIFAMLYRPRRRIDKQAPRSPYVVERIQYHGEVVDVTEMAVYQRFQAAVTRTAGAIRARSTGRIHGYIGFVLVTLLVVLLLYGRP